MFEVTDAGRAAMTEMIKAQRKAAQGETAAHILTTGVRDQLADRRPDVMPGDVAERGPGRNELSQLRDMAADQASSQAAQARRLLGRRQDGSPRIPASTNSSGLDPRALQRGPLTAGHAAYSHQYEAGEPATAAPMLGRLAVHGSGPMVQALGLELQRPMPPGRANSQEPA